MKKLLTTTMLLFAIVLTIGCNETAGNANTQETTTTQEQKQTEPQTTPKKIKHKEVKEDEAQQTTEEEEPEEKGPSNFKGLVYVLSSDDYVSVKYTRAYSESGSDFITKYTIYHPSKGYAWITVTATHNKADKTVKVSIDDTNEGIFSHINDEETTYDTPSLVPFGFRGNVGALAGKRVPNQLMLKFASSKYETVKVVHVLGSEKSDFNNTMYFVLDEKN